MNLENLKSYLEMGEGIKVEYKKAVSEIPKSVYETVVAFANRQGGIILLGVDDNGKVVGVEKDKIEKMKSDFTTAINSKKIEPSMYLDINHMEIEEKSIIYINIPESSQVHRLNGTRIMDRTVSDGDIDITNNSFEVEQMYLRKNHLYSENRIVPYLKIEDFRKDLIERVRKQLSRNYIGEAANEMSDFDIIKSMGMYQTDLRTREKGFTVAAVLCFGKDDIIASVIPYWRVDVLERIEDVERYDSRLDISTNLIDTYYRVMDFIDKQQSLPERFFLEGTIRMPIRNILFRELIANMLVHREISNAFVSTVHIYREKVDIKNANKPVHAGMIRTPEINPFPKNPSIARVFKTLGIIDELGSGMNKIFKYGKMYFNSEPIIENEELFKVSFFKNGIEGVRKVEDKGVERVENAPQNLENAPQNLENAPQNLENAPQNLENAPQKDKNISKKIKMEERRKEIIKLLKSNENIKKTELVKLLDISIDTVKRDLKYLKERNVIEYIGNSRNGKWIVKEKK